MSVSLRAERPFRWRTGSLTTWRKATPYKAACSIPTLILRFHPASTAPKIPSDPSHGSRKKRSVVRRRRSTEVMHRSMLPGTSVRESRVLHSRALTTRPWMKVLVITGAAVKPRHVEVHRFRHAERERHVCCMARRRARRRPMTGTPSYFLKKSFRRLQIHELLPRGTRGCGDRTGGVLIYCDVACSPKPKLIMQLHSPHQPPAPSAR